MLQLIKKKEKEAERREKEIQAKEKDKVKKEQERTKELKEQLRKQRKNVDEKIKKVKKEMKAKAKEEAKKEKEKAKEERKRVKDLEKQLRKQEANKEKEIEREVKEARKEAEEEAQDKASKRIDKELSKRDRKISTLQSDLNKANRRLESLQGEERGSIREEEILDHLKMLFPLDAFRRVPKGESGADIIQTVQNRKGKELGKIVYEVKDTSSWQNKYLTRGKAYTKKYKTPHVILVTRAFPKGEKYFAVRDEIVLVNKSLLKYASEIVRKAIKDLASEQLSKKGKQKKMKDLYTYINSAEFKERMGGINDEVDELQSILKKERTWHRSKWNQQEEHINEIINLSAEISDSVNRILSKTGKEAKVVSLPV